MKRLLPLLLSACLLVSCGSGDSFNPSVELQAAAECTGLSLENLVTIYNSIIDLLDEIGDGTIPPNMTYDIATGAYTITLTIGDVAGTVSSAFNLNDGLGVGESATAIWQLNGGLAGGGVTAEGSFTVARATATSYTVSGIGGTAETNCDFDFTSLNFAVTTTTGVNGTIVFEATTPDGVLDGTMTFNGSQYAGIVATFDGVSYQFLIDLATFEPVF
ncbi:MAG: hypothetical protein ACHQ1G_04030 [Planctomycetota bacterium]